MSNDNLLLVCGKSATGKSVSLMGIAKPKATMYLNFEAGKKLPFKAEFIKGKDGRVGITVTDPKQVPALMAKIESMPEVENVIFDTITYMMSMYESMHVLPSADSRSEWGNYFQFFNNLMLNIVANSTKNIIMLAHTSDIFNEKDGVVETIVKFKGSLMNLGIESYFSTVVATKKMTIKRLKVENPLLTYTPLEEAKGFKYVFQTDLTKETVNERIRAPFSMFSQQELYIDNNVQHVLDRFNTFYED